MRRRARRSIRSSDSSDVGTIGEREQKLDFTALGDAVNLTQRLSSVAEAGEVLFGDETVRAAGLDTAALRSRELELKGIGRPVAAWALRMRGRYLRASR